MSQMTQHQRAAGGTEQSVPRTASGHIDFEACYDRARAVRAEAAREMLAAMTGMWRRRAGRLSGRLADAADRQFARS